jgi:hypothetical protein
MGGKGSGMVEEDGSVLMVTLLFVSLPFPMDSSDCCSSSIAMFFI